MCAEVPLTQPRGMFLRRWLPVAALLQAAGSGGGGGPNILAVRVEPPEHVGCVDGGGQGGDHGIAQDVAAQYVEGWDWQMVRGSGPAPAPERMGRGRGHFLNAGVGKAVGRGALGWSGQ